MFNGNSFYTEKTENTQATEPAQPRVAFVNHKDALKRANRIILNQHMAVTEEQRLNVLFQVLGITFHELNQPLTSLLGNVELMLLNQDHPQKLKENIKRVEEAGKRFSSILRKIQNIRQGKSMILDGRFCPMKTNKTWNIQLCVQDEKVLQKIQNLTEGLEETLSAGFENTSPWDSFIVKDDTDLVILDEETFLSAPNQGLVRRIRSKHSELPILAILTNKNERLAFALIHEGVDDYCTLAELDSHHFNHMISNVKEKAWGRHQLKSALNDLAGVSIQDEQTGLFQRRFFKDALDREATMARRKETPCIACKLDIEGILGCSRTHGGNDHAKALMEAAKVIQNSLGNAADLVCRYGNESFAFILSNTCAEEARRICQALQAALEGHLFDTMPLETQPRIYVGMTLFSSGHTLSTQELMKKLDDATAEARITGQSPVLL